MAVLAGYQHFREVGKSLCMSFCLHDPKCTAMTYSVYEQPHSSSLCKVHSSTKESVNVVLKLKKQDGSNGILSNLVLFISKQQNVYLLNAKLEGSSYSNSTRTYGSCNTACTEDLFCDAFSYSHAAGTCSMFLIKSITNIVIDNESVATFIGLHPN